MYIRSQPEDNTYYTDGSLAAAVVHRQRIIVRLNDSASVLDAEMLRLRGCQWNKEQGYPHRLLDSGDYTK